MCINCDIEKDFRAGERLEVPKGAKPFDMQKALAGEKVINRSGEEVVVYMEDYPLRNFKTQECYTIEGNFYSNRDKSKKDLFMAPKTTKVYCNVYKSKDGKYTLGSVFYNEEKALQSVADFAPFRKNKYIRTISLDIEEN